MLAKLAAVATCAARSGATVEALQTTAAPAVSLPSANVLVCCPLSFDVVHQHCGQESPGPSTLSIANRVRRIIIVRNSTNIIRDSINIVCHSISIVGTSLSFYYAFNAYKYVTTMLTSTDRTM